MNLLEVHTTKAPLLVAIVFSWATGVGCSPGEQSEVAAQWFEERVIDGVRMVESARPGWEPGEGWVIDPAPILEIGADLDDPNQHFFSIGAVDLLRDGRIVVLDGGARVARFFSPSGEFLQAVGGPGEGPGEFQRVRSLARCGADTDTLVVGELSRVSLLDSDGSFLRTEEVTPRLADVPLGVFGVSSDCSELLLLDRPGVTPRENGYRRPLIFYWAETSTAARDTVGSFPGHLLMSIPRGDFFDIPVPFSATTEWATRGDRLFLGYSGEPEVQVFDRESGLTEVHRWAVDRHPITSADAVRFGRLRARLVRGNRQMERMMPSLDGYPLEPFKPLFSRLVVDDEGNVWIQRYPVWAAGFPAAAGSRAEEDDGPDEWWVLDANGRLLGSVFIPNGLRIHQISDGVIVAVARGGMDEELVRLHRIVR